MPDPFPHGSSRAAGSNQAPRASLDYRLAQFEARQRHLWWLTYFLLGLLTLAYAAVSWPAIRAIAQRYEFLLPVLVLVRGIEQRAAAPPDEHQLDKLFSVIERSQQGYRDLIDSFDDVLIAVNLDGEVRAANRSFADLVGATFQEIVGHRLSEFLEDGGGEGPGVLERHMPRFLESRHWTGVVQVRLKKRNTINYFDCVIHAMLRDGQVHGMTVLARDITASRRNEARFTELFETLQEGIYIVTPEDQILDANPALVRILGYESKSELLLRKVSEVFPDDSIRKVIRHEVDRQPVLEGREITLLRKD